MAMARGWPRIRLLSGAGVGEIPDGHRWDAPPKVRFARDSPLEGGGFEPSVPAEPETPPRARPSGFPRPAASPVKWIDARGPMSATRYHLEMRRARTCHSRGLGCRNRWHQHARASLPELASDEPADPSVEPVISAVFPLSFSIPTLRFWRHGHDAERGARIIAEIEAGGGAATF